jgi:hypothetical protein
MPFTDEVIAILEKEIHCPVAARNQAIIDALRKSLLKFEIAENYFSWGRNPFS